jgi:hypothetical protein
MIADFAELARGVPVRHPMHDGSIAGHVPIAAARLLPTASSATTVGRRRSCEGSGFLACDGGAQAA